MKNKNYPGCSCNQKIILDYEEVKEAIEAFEEDENLREIKFNSDVVIRRESG